MGAINTSGTGDAGGIGANNINDIRDIGGTDCLNNNTDNKNAYIKACFSTNNIACADISDINNIDEKVSKNINNTILNQLNRIDWAVKNSLNKANKGGVSETNKSKADGANKSKIDRANKSKISRANKSEVGKANIKVGKKANARAIASIDNNAASGNKVINWYIHLVNLAFTAIAAANYVSDFNLIVSKKTFLGIIISTFNNFIITFAVLANTILIKKTNIYEFNRFLFAINCQ